MRRINSVHMHTSCCQMCSEKEILLQDFPSTWRLTNDEWVRTNVKIHISFCLWELRRAVIQLQRGAVFSCNSVHYSAVTAHWRSQRRSKINYSNWRKDGQIVNMNLNVHYNWITALLNSQRQNEGQTVSQTRAAWCTVKYARNLHHLPSLVWISWSPFIPFHSVLGIHSSVGGEQQVKRPLRRFHDSCAKEDNQP
jgi:hypothetical protein